MKEIIGRISLKYSIPCRGDVLGRSYPSTINGENVKIVFPEIVTIADPRDPEHNKKCPVVKAPLGFKEGDNWRWGAIRGYNANLLNDHSTIETYIDMVGITLSIEEEQIEEAVNDIAAGINKWRAQLHERTNILDKSLIEAADIEVFDNKGEGEGLDLYLKETGTRFSIKQKSIITGVIRDLKSYLTPDELKTILSEIDISKQLKQEYQMFSRATCEHRSGNTRYAIMEATTAVELCITQKIQDRCLELGIDGKGLCDAFYRSLGNRFDFLKQLRVELATKDPQNEIVKPRNNLFHNRKIEPSKKESASVICAARKYLELYTPVMYE